MMRLTTSAARIATSLALMGGVLVGAAAVSSEAAPATPTSPRAYEAPGPSSVTVTKTATHTIYRPTTLVGERPIVIWGNGTGAVPAIYDTQLRQLASWGFVVAAANTTQAGSGRAMLAGATYLIAEDKKPGSVFFGHIDETKVGAAGHSQGGGGAIVAGEDPLVDTTVALMPGPYGSESQLKGPIFYLAGQLDYIVPAFYVKYRFQQTTGVPAVLGVLKNSDHFFPGDAKVRAMGAVTAWFRYWLTGDQAAKSVFFGPAAGMSSDRSAWSTYSRNAAADGLS